MKETRVWIICEMMPTELGKRNLSVCVTYPATNPTQ